MVNILHQIKSSSIELLNYFNWVFNLFFFFFCFLDSCFTEDPIKSLLSICLFVCLSVRLSVRHVTQECFLVFSDFFCDGRWLEYLKTDRVLFFQENVFLPIFGKNGPKWPQNSFLVFFWKVLLLVLCGNNLKWKHCNIVIDISSLVPYLGKFWFLSYGWKCCWPIKLQDSLKCNISRRKRMIKCIFGMQINTYVF